MVKLKVSMYCVKGRHKFMAIDPEVVVLPKGRSKVRMRAYKAVCPKHRVESYRIIGKA